MGLHNRDAQLQSSLILYSWRTPRIPTRLCPSRRRRRRSTYEMRCINLYLITPLGLHLPQRQLCVLQQDRVLHIPKAHGDARCVRHGMRAYANEVGRERPSGGTEDELEGIFSVELEPGELGGCIG